MPGTEITSLRIASFNIRNGRAFDGTDSWPFRRRATLHTIAGLGADLLGLQEVYRCQLTWLGHHLHGYEAVGRGRNDGRRGEHTPVLARRAVARIVGHRTRWYGAEPDRPGTRLDGAPFPRIATMTTVELASGARLQLTNTHLDSRSPDRRRQSVGQLLGWLDPSLPQLLVGDFNADPDGAMFQPLLAAGFRHALAADAGGSAHEFTGRTDGRRIDHILVGPGVSVAAARVVHGRPGERLPSDHWPLVADLAIPTAGADTA